MTGANTSLPTRVVELLRATPAGIWLDARVIAAHVGGSIGAVKLCLRYLARQRIRRGKGSVPFLPDASGSVVISRPRPRQPTQPGTLIPEYCMGIPVSAPSDTVPPRHPGPARPGPARVRPGRLEHRPRVGDRLFVGEEWVYEVESVANGDPTCKVWNMMRPGNPVTMTLQTWHHKVRTGGLWYERRSFRTVSPILFSFLPEHAKESLLMEVMRESPQEIRRILLSVFARAHTEGL